MPGNPQRYAVGFYRVSTAEQGNSGLGLEAQQASVRAFVAVQSWTLVAEFFELVGARAQRPQAIPLLPRGLQGHRGCLDGRVARCQVRPTLGRTAMRYIVEVANQRGKKATKEYEAKTSDELRTKIAKDLRFYPEIHIAEVWKKRQPSIHISLPLVTHLAG
jgi:hypothetical protein